MRIAEGTQTNSAVVAEYKLDWSQWQSPVDVNVGPDLWVAVRPWELHSRGLGRRAWGTQPARGVAGWGKVSAYKVMWGVKAPIDVQHPDIVRGLRDLEQMEALAWLVRAVDGDD